MRFLAKNLVAATAILVVVINMVPALAADSISDIEKAYRTFLQAALDKDWKNITEGSSMEARKELETIPQEQRPMILDMLKSMSADLVKSKLDSEEVNGEESILLLHIPKEKGTNNGRVVMRKEGGRWRVHSQDWKETN